jgi:hypothetical protein
MLHIAKRRSYQIKRGQITNSILHAKQGKANKYRGDFMQYQDNDVKAFRNRYRTENLVILDKRTDALCRELYGAASQASAVYLAKKERVFNQRELDLLRKETLEAFCNVARAKIKKTRDEVRESSLSLQKEMQQLFSVKPGELAQAAHDRELMRARIRASSLKELKEEARIFIKDGATGFETERINTLAAELRNRGDHETADQIRFADVQQWHVSEPWLNTESYKVVEMENEDVQTVTNALEAGSVYGISDGHFTSASFDRLFPQKLTSDEK